MKRFGFKNSNKKILSLYIDKNNSWRLRKHLCDFLFTPSSSYKPRRTLAADREKILKYFIKISSSCYLPVCAWMGVGWGVSIGSLPAMLCLFLQLLSGGLHLLVKSLINTSHPTCTIQYWCPYLHPQEQSPVTLTSACKDAHCFFFQMVYWIMQPYQQPVTAIHLSTLCSILRQKKNRLCTVDILQFSRTYTVVNRDHIYISSQGGQCTQVVS